MACTPNCGWCGRCTDPWERETDDIPVNGPRQCCADFAFITDDVDGEQHWKCFYCERKWCQTAVAVEHPF